MLGKQEEALAAFERLVREIGDESWARTALRDFLANNLLSLAEKATEMALAARPEWEWLDHFREVALAGARERKAQDLRARAGRALAQGDRNQALAIMREVLELTPQDGVSLVAAAGVVQDSDPDQALEWLVKGLSARVGGAGQWSDLGGLLFQRGDNRGAAAAYRRCLAMDHGQAAAEARLKTAGRRLRQDREYVSLAQKPPRMIIFLASGLSRDLVQLAAPDFLMGRAWGGLKRGQGGVAMGDLARWATLFTARGEKEHGLLDKKDQVIKTTIAELPLVTLWDVIGREKSLGLLAAPLCAPPLGLKGWCAAGPPHGLLEPGLVEPSSLAPVLLAEGFRPDYVASQFEAHVFAHTLMENRSYEAGCYEAERAKFRAALQMPSVDVLALGYHFLDRMHPRLDWEGNRMFSAYQQFYGWVDAALSALKPDDFAILSQRGYARGSKQPNGEAFYCLSWLRGENATADPVEVAPRVLERLGLEPGELGTRRQGLRPKGEGL